MNELFAALRRAQTYNFRGRLAADPEIRYFESGTCVANAKIAVDHPEKKGRDDSKPSDWFKIELWGDAAKAFADGAHKGQLIDVSGRVRPEEPWTNRNGETVQGWIIRAHHWAPVDTGAPAQTAAPAPAAAAPAWESSATGDDDIPF